MNDNVDPRTGVHRIRKKRNNKSSSRRSVDPDGAYGSGDAAAAPAGFDGAAFDQEAAVLAAAGSTQTVYPPFIPQ